MKTTQALIWANVNEDATEEEQIVETSVDIKLEAPLEFKQRESIRTELEQCFSNIWQKKAKVLFSDELDQ